MTKAIMLAGTKSGVGKTTVSMGLMALLSRRLSVQPFKVGPDYIDSAYHTYITGNSSSNLDSFILSPEAVSYFYHKNSLNKDISIIEGVMGLFDGKEVGKDIGTSSSIAKITGVPVILVADGSKVASSIAATVKGFAEFDKDLKISGVVLNNVGSESHYNILKDAIEHYTDVKPCGYLLKNSYIEIPERHLGLLPAMEQDNLEMTLNLLADTVEETVDIESILEIADSASKGSVDYNPTLFNKFKDNRGEINIGIARDRAFNFYYKDSLDLLSELYGVNWVEFSPLDDIYLPKNLHGLYIGGGFPEVFSKELESNSSFKDSLVSALEGGLPYIAECGGLMYLLETLKDLNGNEFKMAGWLKGSSKMTKRLQRFGYAELKKEERKISVHEFHRSVTLSEEDMVYKLNKSRKDRVVKSWECGFKKGQGVAAYAHFHFGSNPEFALDFINRCRAYREGQ